MQLPRLQYISDGKTYQEQLSYILSALDAGVQWVQLRWKHAEIKELEKLSEKVKKHCDKYNAILIINDYPEIARKIKATGVHLGLNDMPINDARKILFSHQWIGGTANTFQDVLQRIKENVTYIGLGPLRYTVTKEKLSPTLGYDGYKTILSSCNGNVPPVYAIGGIMKEDIRELLSRGVYGVAISSSINKAQNKKQYIQQLNDILYGKA